MRDDVAHDANGNHTKTSKPRKEDWSGTFEWIEQGIDI